MCLHLHSMAPHGLVALWFRGAAGGEGGAGGLGGGVNWGAGNIPQRGEHGPGGAQGCRRNPIASTDQATQQTVTEQLPLCPALCQTPSLHLILRSYIRKTERKKLTPCSVGTSQNYLLMEAPFIGGLTTCPELSRTVCVTVGILLAPLGLGLLTGEQELLIPYLLDSPGSFSLS